MMKNRGTWLFALVVALVAGLAYYDYSKRFQRSEDLQAEGQVFGPLDLNEIIKVMVRRGDTLSLKFHRDDIGWIMTSPLKDRLSRSEAVFFVSDIIKEKIHKLNSGSATKDSFGLKTPKGEITLTNRNGEDFKVFIGENSVFDESVYLSKPRDEDIYVGSQDWAKYLNEDGERLRNRDVFPFRSEFIEIIGFELESSDWKLQFSKKNEKWSEINGQISQLNTKVLEEIIDNVGNLKAVNIVSNVNDKRAQRAFNLLHSQLKIKMDVLKGYVGKTTQEKWAIRFGKGYEGYIFGIVDDVNNNNIYRFEEKRIQKLMKTKSDFEKSLENSGELGSE